MVVSLPFVTLDVFTTTRYKGNPLAIIRIPAPRDSEFSRQISQEQKQAIAREFNFSETVFLYDADETADAGSGSGSEPSTNRDRTHPVQIFTISQEITFAGHPTIGTSAYLFQQDLARSQPEVAAGETEDVMKLTLHAKAGKILASYDAANEGLVRLALPHNIIIQSHSVTVERAGQLIGLDASDAAQHILPNLPGTVASPSESASANGSGAGCAVVSVVEGMPFLLVHVDSLEVLAAVRPVGLLLPAEEVGVSPDLKKYISIYIYCFTDDQGKTVAGADSRFGQWHHSGDGTQRSTNVRSRQFFLGRAEDPATGSASSGFAAFNTLLLSEASAAQGGPEKAPINHRYNITQGVEMGRQSDIVVDIKLKGEGGATWKGQAVNEVYLSGRAVQVSEGNNRV